MSWRDEQRPASFRGVPFKVQANTRIGGRRGFTYEFAKSERSVDEDLGRRVSRASVSAYVIGLDCLEQADDLELALQAEGGGLLVLPTMGQAILRCEVYQRIETKDEGGIVRFEMSFVRSQSGAVSQAPPEDTQAASRSAAAQTATASELSAGTDDDWS